MFGTGMEFLEPNEMLMVAINRSVIVMGFFLFIMGIGLLLAPKTLIKIGDILNRSISTENVENFLEKVHSVENAVIKQRVVFGIISLCMGGWILYQCWRVISIG